jgi:FlaA1/EpsC-like NDP-sugar epimerase
LLDKCVLITGAAGSIGSEIVRQVLKFRPKQVILCDQAETALHTLLLELDALEPTTDIVPYLADIRNINRMEELFRSYRPQVVYHAAAYKRVPMMEISPTEAILNNLEGTRTVSDLAVSYGAERFVMISTDKAVNPTNIMGASKRLAEMYIQSLHNNGSDGATRFITTRFGNVLGSNGSVVQLFREQIEKGGPVTVTDPGIVRYFMTIPEACQLVLEAGAMGNGGEIFVFDMGKPVAIAGLAEKMIRLYGLVPGEDIQIVYTGLRPGEKLYEEVLNDGENVLPTYHEKIMIARIRGEGKEDISAKLDDLIIAARAADSVDIIVNKISELVPEFISTNPVYSSSG